MQIQVLGPVRAWRDGEEIDLGSAGRRAVLALLAMAGGQPVTRGELVDALWGDRSPASATNVIQTHVKHLRRVLDPARRRHAPSAVLPAVGDGYALRLRADQLDLVRFRQLTGSAAEVRRSGDQRRAATLLGQALRLWQGAPLADLPLLSTHPKVVALSGERRAALLAFSDAMVALGEADGALAPLAEAAAAEPLDEAVQARLIRAYQAAGRQAAAFTVYRTTRQRLADELGIAPGAELVAAHAALLEETPHPEPPTRDEPEAGGADTGTAATPPNRRPRRPVPAQLPADVPGFTGRTAELDQLAHLAGTDGGDNPARPTAAVTVAVCGTAGAGKTALVTHWAHQVRERFPHGQLHVDLRGHDPDQPVPPEEALSRFLAALGVTGEEVPLDLEERAARYRTELTGRRMLVVLDNAASVEQVRPLLPGTPSCVAVVTSRDSMPGLVALHGARRIDVGQLPPPDAIELLRRLVGERADAEPAAVAALADQCARLPLALRVAAELATSRPGTSLAELVGELADRQHRLELLDAGGYDRAAVRTVFSWSYQHLPADAARAFRQLGLAPFPDLDPYAAAALHGTTVDEGRRLLRQLGRAHLVQPAGAGRFGMHDLLHAYAAELAAAEDADTERAAALARLLDHYLATTGAAMDVLYPAERHHRPTIAAPATPVPPLADPATARGWLDAERPNLVATCSFAAVHGWPEHAVGLAATLYRYLEGGHHTDGLTVHTHALHAAEKAGDTRGQALALTNLGAVHRLLGRYPQATEHCERALALYHRDSDHLGEARALSNLAIVDERLGRNTPALERYERALALYQEAGDRYGEASTLNNMASVYGAFGRDDVATERYRRALALYREIGERAGEAIALANLGMFDEQAGRHREAAAHLEEALVLFRELGHRYGEAGTLNGLGDVRARLGDHRQAAAHQARALALFRELGHRYGEASALNGLGEALHGEGDLGGAITRYDGALAIAVETGDRDEEVRAHTGLARAYEGAGDRAAARRHWRRALELHADLGSLGADTIRDHLAAHYPER
ncbi:MAG: AfsR/SARP family transcriptional regulator [Mycobacteriales bacterium]